MYRDSKRQNRNVDHDIVDTFLKFKETFDREQSSVDSVEDMQLRSNPSFSSSEDTPKISRKRRQQYCWKGEVAYNSSTRMHKKERSSTCNPEERVRIIEKKKDQNGDEAFDWKKKGSKKQCEFNLLVQREL